MADRSLRYVLSATDRNASRTINDVSRTGERASSRLGTAFKDAGKMIAGAFALEKVGQFISGSLDEATEAQKVGAQTTAVLKSTGDAAGVTADEIGNLAGAISAKAGIDDEAIQSGENLLLTYTNIRNEAGKGNDIFSQTTSIMADLSVATGVSMTSAANMLGKALNDPIAGVSKLTKVGVTFTQQQKDQIQTLSDNGDAMGAQKIILAELSKEFGGSAEAQATDADKAKVAWGNLQEQVGTALLPVLNDLSTFLTDDVVPAFSAVVDFAQNNSDWLVPLIAGVGGLWVAWKGYTIVRSATTAISTAAAKIGPALTTIGTRANSAGTALAGLKGKGLVGAVGLAAVGVGVYALGNKLSDMLEKGSGAAYVLDGKLSDGIKHLRDELHDTNGAITESIRLEQAKQLQDSGLADKAEKAGISLNHLRGGINGSDESFRNLIETWKAGGDPSERTLALATALHIQYKEGSKQADQLAGAERDHSRASRESAVSQGKLGTQVRIVNAQVRTQILSVGDLSKQLQGLSGDAVSAEQAELSFKDGLAEATQQVKDNGSSLSENTEKGRSNREWLLNQITSLNDVANAQAQADGNTKRATQTMHTNREELRKAATDAGMNTDAVDALIRKYVKIPKYKATTLDINGNAMDGVDHIATWLDTITGQRWTVQVNAEGNITSGSIGTNGPKFNAAGTDNFSGGRTRVAEREPEIIAARGTQIMPLSQFTGASGGSRGPVELTVIVQAVGPVAPSRAMGEQVGRHIEAYLGSGGRIAGMGTA